MPLAQLSTAYSRFPSIGILIAGRLASMLFMISTHSQASSSSVPFQSQMICS